MVQFRLAEVLEAKGWTAYRLSAAVRELGGELSMRAVYRMARPGNAVRRVDLDTLDLLCRALDVTPADLFTYRPSGRRPRGPGR